LKITDINGSYQTEHTDGQGDNTRHPHVRTFTFNQIPLSPHNGEPTQGPTNTKGKSLTCMDMLMGEYSLNSTPLG